MPGPVRVLVVEPDEARRADLLFAALDEGIELDFDTTAEAAAARLAQPHGFVAAIIALTLPDEDGLALIARLRAAGVRMPLLLTVEAQADNIVVRGLDAGASDVIAYPFRPAILRARLRAQLRGFTATDEKELALGGYRFDTESRTLTDPRSSRTTRLTEKESALLRYLHRAGGRAVTREELLREVWGYAPDANSHTVATHIHRLRRKIEQETGGPRFLHNDENGYRLDLAWQPIHAAEPAR
jgi:DNA-binding response OmpR family regulator